MFNVLLPGKQIGQPNILLLHICLQTKTSYNNKNNNKNTRHKIICMNLIIHSKHVILKIIAFMMCVTVNTRWNTGV